MVFEARIAVEYTAVVQVIFKHILTNTLDESASIEAHFTRDLLGERRFILGVMASR